MSARNLTESSDRTSGAPASFKAWLAVTSVALGTFVLVTSEFLPIGLLTSIAPSLHVSAGVAGLMTTMPGLVAAVAAPAITIAAGRTDRRYAVLALVGLLSVSDLLAAIAPSFAVMLVARVLFGIALGGFWTIAVTLGNRLVPAPSTARATAIILSGISIATVAGVPLGTVIANLAGWRIGFAVIGATALLIGVVQFLVLPSLPAPPAPGLAQITHLLQHADARLGLLTVAFVLAGHFAAYTYVTPFLRVQAGVSPGVISALLLAYGAAGIVGNFAAGAAAARNLRSTLNGVITLLAGAVLLLPLLGGSPFWVTVLLMAWGLAFGAAPITLNLWVFKTAPDALEGGAALLVSTYQVFIGLGSVAGGRLVDSLGTSAPMWAGGCAVMAALLIVSWSKHVAPSASPRREPTLA